MSHITSNFILPSTDKRVGNFVCSYLSHDQRVQSVGNKLNKDGKVVVTIITKNNIDAKPCLDEAIIKCKDDVNKILITN